MGGAICAYMAEMQDEPNASQLWLYFDSVITWLETNFKHTKDRKAILQGLDWGSLYDKYGKQTLDAKAIERETVELLTDDEVQNRKGIIPYILTRDTHYLDLREFPESIKRTVYEEQGHRCANPNCPEKDREFDISEMDADHITPWVRGGRTVKENCQMLCRLCNQRKSGS